MANVRCTECGRFVNEPADHDPSCSLYQKKDVYVHDEAANRPRPKPDEDPLRGRRYAVGTDAPYLP